MPNDRFNGRSPATAFTFLIALIARVTLEWCAGQNDRGLSHGFNVSTLYRTHDYTALY